MVVDGVDCGDGGDVVFRVMCDWLWDGYGGSLPLED